MRTEKSHNTNHGGWFWILVIIMALLRPSAVAQTCDPRVGTWDTDIGVPGLNPGAVEALEVYNDGNGSKLYAGGGFKFAGGDSVFYIAKWLGGGNWDRLHPTVDLTGNVLALKTWAHGGTSQLYIGGRFQTTTWEPPHDYYNYVASWDGQSYNKLVDNGVIGVNGFAHVMEIYQGDLYIGGEFTIAGGRTVNHIAKWDGTRWWPLGTGTDGTVRAMAVWNDGGGDALFVGGDFMNAGGQRVNYIAKWNGTSWSPLNYGVDFYVNALSPWDDGTGSTLYVGGSFYSACTDQNCTNGVRMNNITEWDGTSWFSLPRDATPDFRGTAAEVRVLFPYDDKSDCHMNNFLFAGGEFRQAGGGTANRIAKYDGSNWIPLLDNSEPSSNGVSAGVYAIKDHANDDYPTASLYVGGAFVQVWKNGQLENSDLISEWTLPCIWDLDCDGQVNPVDLGIVQSHFGCIVDADPACAAADFDGDCQVNPVDAGIVQAHFGACQ